MWRSQSSTEWYLQHIWIHFSFSLHMGSYFLTCTVVNIEKKNINLWDFQMSSDCLRAATIFEKFIHTNTKLESFSNYSFHVLSHRAALIRYPSVSLSLFQGGGLVLSHRRGRPAVLRSFHRLLLCDGLWSVPVLHHPACVWSVQRWGHADLHLEPLALLHLDSCKDIRCLGGLPGKREKCYSRAKELHNPLNLNLQRCFTCVLVIDRLSVGSVCCLNFPNISHNVAAVSNFVVHPD